MDGGAVAAVAVSAGPRAERAPQSAKPTSLRVPLAESFAPTQIGAIEHFLVTGLPLAIANDNTTKFEARDS